MGAIYTQPQHLTTVDWGNPITRGLVGLFDAVKGIDLVDGGFPLTNSATQGIVNKGRIANFSNSAQIYQTKPRYAVTGALTIFTPIVVTSLANYSGILSKSSDYSTFPFELRLGSSATTSEIDFQRGGGGTASAFKGSGSLISANPGVVQYLAVRCTSGDLNVAPDVFVNKAKTTLGRNGYATITGTASDNGSSLRVGNRFDTTTYLNGGIQYLALWNRALTDYEIATLSDNPWQIFKAQQRRIFVASAGGGTNITATLGTATANGFTANVNAQTAIAATLATATASGFDANVNASTVISAALGTAAANGFTANVNAITDIAATIGTATASGFTANVDASTAIAAILGTATASGFDANVDASTAISTTLGTATASGFDATVSNAGGINATMGTATAAGFTANVDASTAISATIGTCTASGHTANVNASTAINSTMGAATASGYTANVNASTAISATLGAATASGFLANVNAIRIIDSTLGIATASGFNAAVSSGVVGQAIILGPVTSNRFTGPVTSNRFTGPVRSNL